MTARATARHRKEMWSGAYLDYENIRAKDITLVDIAHGLAHTCRFGGHSRIFYSVAEHAILVSSLLLERHPGAWPLALHALHHDDHEAYVGDLPTPLKNVLGPRYKRLVDTLDAAICQALGLGLPSLTLEPVKRADAEALRMEAHLLLPSKGVSAEWAPAWERYGLHDPPRSLITPGLLPTEARDEFLRAHFRLLREAERIGWYPL